MLQLLGALDDCQQQAVVLDGLVVAGAQKHEVRSERRRVDAVVSYAGGQCVCFDQQLRHCLR